MGNKMPFHWHAGQALASFVPCRRRGLIVRSQVSEWAAALPVAKAAFCLGCALALGSRSAAERALTEAAVSDAHDDQGQPWRTAFSEVIDYLEAAQEENRSTDTVTVEDFYAELTDGKYTDTLLTRQECVVRLSQWVISGLVLGVLFPETGERVLAAWVARDRTVETMGVSGQQVGSLPPLSSVDEACKRAQSLYEAWLGE